MFVHYLGLFFLGLSMAGCAGETAAQTACADKRAEQTALLEASRGCSIDSDCTEVVAFCNFENRVDCTGVFYVSRDIDMDAFNRLEEELNQCTPHDDCGTCLMTSPKPVCHEGLCVKGTEFSD